MQRTKESFFTRDRRYVYLSGSLLALLCLSLLHSREPNSFSFLRDGNAATLFVTAVCWFFLAVSVLALIVKLTHWESYSASFLRKNPVIRFSRCLFLLLALVCLLCVIDRVVLNLVDTIRLCKAMDSNPQAFGASMIYMSIKGKDILLTGIWTTVRIALLGTGIAFILAMFMVFLRIQEPDKRDNDFVRLVKWIASHFARFYIFIIRGTPMMVQALIFYYFGFNLFKRTNMTVTEINHVWSFFISGLCTVALNSTAYLTEVLRGGIQAIDRGQMEAARSVGMTHWQAMMKVVFPQAVKNSIPAIGNEFIINIKDSSVLSVIGVMDLMYATKSISGIYFRSLEIYCVAAILYLILTYLSSLLLKYLGKKLDTPYRGITSSN
ncbi:MAG: amino acid ABC transporter permease [Oscillospiraceae bacterium]|nr:amino acid ABC transporter permease [Oscillospiraceae bacterium]